MNVTLRPWTIADVDLYLQMTGRVDFCYEDASLKSKNLSEASCALEDMLRSEVLNGDFYRAILLDGEVVGNVQVVLQSGVWRFDGHVGCMISNDVSGRGVGTEALRQMVTMVFTRRPYDRLTAIVYSPNRASARMVEKVGFNLEATLCRAVHKGGNVYDALVYGLLREQTGIDKTLCRDPEDELSAEELSALEPTMKQQIHK